MPLHIRTWGTGDRTALLVHGLTTDSTGFWRLGPELAGRGYRVIAPDLPGHGHSDRLDRYTLGALRDALVGAAPAGPDLAIGHSLGGLLLLGAREQITADRYVYLDPFWGPAPGEEVAGLLRAQKHWSAEDLAAAQPRWLPEAVAAKLGALARWDPRTIEAVRGLAGTTPEPPAAPSLVVLADPSETVPRRTAEELPGRGYTVRTVAKAGHILHNDDFDGTLEALRDWI